jgi:demethylmenaquinone methyltransferase / 2-methoxy-6-polyprenyl-1,4-benzoquinol methylase
MQNPTYVHEAFSQISERYVVTNHVLSLGTDILWRKKVARLVRDLKPQRLLDLATGSGDLAMEIQRKSPGTKIIGADFCDPMLEMARKRNLDDIEWMVADAMDLPFPDASFDVVTVAFGLRNMASWPDATREMARVIRPGGHFIVLDFSLPTLPILRPAYRFYLHKVLPKIAGLITGQRAAFEYLSNSIEAFPSGPDMCQLLNENGLEKSKAIPLNFGIASIYVGQKPA